LKRERKAWKRGRASERESEKELLSASYYYACIATIY
jgi:hypothetical protein